MQPSFSSSHVLPLLTWMDRTHQVDIRWVSLFPGDDGSQERARRTKQTWEDRKCSNSKLALCCLTCHCAWEMAGASRQWQHPHVDIFKTRSGAGSGCRAATRDFDRSGAFLIWTSLMDLNGPMFGSHINARLFPIFPNFGGGWCFYPQNPGVPHCQKPPPGALAPMLPAIRPFQPPRWSQTCAGMSPRTSSCLVLRVFQNTSGVVCRPGKPERNLGTLEHAFTISYDIL